MLKISFLFITTDEIKSTFLIITMITLLLNLPSLISAQEFNWTSPQSIEDFARSDCSIAIDSDGKWHVVYDNVTVNGDIEKTTIEHISESTGPSVITETTYNRITHEGEVIVDPSIDVGPDGSIHVIYRLQSHSIDGTVMYTRTLEPLVVLIHGITGSDSSWGGSRTPNLESLLEEDGKVVKHFSYHSSNIGNWDVPISNLSGWLDDSLNQWNDEFLIDELGIDIIAHSMGGLIARYYIAHPQESSYYDKVRKLVTLGTPNYGAADALWGSLIPGGVTQAEQMEFGSQFLWDLHRTWVGSSIETDLLCIVGSENYNVPHDGIVLLPSANLGNFGYINCYVPNSHGLGGMAYIEDVNHPSYVAINSFLSGLPPQSNVENVNHLSEGMLIVGLFDQSGNRVNIRTIPFLGLPMIWWNPNPTLYWSWPWWPWFSRLGWGINSESGKYYATGADAGSYEIDIYPRGGYTPIIDYPVFIQRRQTTVLSLTVYPADESFSNSIASGDAAPVIFGNTRVTIDFSSGPGGEVSVYRFDDYPQGMNYTTLPHYWGVESDMSEGSFTAKIVFDYDESEVLDAGINEEDLTVAYVDSLWHSMNTTVDKVSNTVSITTDHFTLFSIGYFVPQSPSLSQNFPNPFANETTILYELSENSDIKLRIYNIRGQLVRTLASVNKTAGSYEVQWNGEDNRGRKCPNGIYLYRLETGDFSITRKMVLVK
jgi:pimeloyl-ACP methyl ester carboxylesterase